MLPADGPRFKLSELEDASGLSKRTIRHFIAEGLVAPAFGSGGGAYYTSLHLQQLEQVKQLRGQRLTIDEIRQLMARPPETPAEAGEVWERIPLHATLELHLRADSPPGVRALVEHLRRVAGEWWEAGDEDDGTYN